MLQDDENACITFSVSFREQSEVFRLPRGATLEELSILLHSAFSAAPSTQKLLFRPKAQDKSSRICLPVVLSAEGREVSSTSLRPGQQRIGCRGSARPILPGTNDASGTSLEEAGIHEGSLLLLLASTDADLELLPDLTADDPTLRGFEEEAQRERLRAGLEQVSVAPGPARPFSTPHVLSQYCVHDFRALQPADVGLLELSPPPEEALKMMHALASDPGIVRIMQKHKWQVGVMTEMPPVGLVGISPRCILGLNRNRGEEISLRLRTDDLRGFRKLATIRITLLHELAHMEHDEHDRHFKALNSQLARESQVQQKGQTVGSGLAADWATLGLPAPSAPSGGPRRLVDGPAPLSRGPPSLAAAAAALGRQHEQEGLKRDALTHRGAEQGYYLHHPLEAPPSPQGQQQQLDRLPVTEGTVELLGDKGVQEQGGVCMAPAAPGSATCGPQGAEGLQPQELPVGGWRVPAGMPPGEALREVGGDASGEAMEGVTVQWSSPPPRQSTPSREATPESAAGEGRQSGTGRDSGPAYPPAAPDSPGLAVSPVAATAAVGGSDPWAEEATVPDELSAVVESARQAEQRLRGALQQLWEETGRDPAAMQRSLSVLGTILRNIREHPQETKYRILRRTNKAFSSTVGCFHSAVSVLRLAGFQDAGGLLEYRATDPGLLWLMCTMLEEGPLIYSGSSTVAAH